MFNGMNMMMMDPEFRKFAQEQMCRMSPDDLMRMTSETIKNMRPEDFQLAADQMKQAQVSYILSAAEDLKKEGNKLHRQGKFSDALQKYQLAKTNLSGLTSSEGRSLLKACSTNLMSCYLKTGQYDECIKEGSEVLAYDAQNNKALFRRGQAYKELDRFEEAVADLNMAHEVDPDDEFVADVLRDAKEKLGTEGSVAAPRGLVIEEITEDVETVDSAANDGSLSTEYSVGEPQETRDVFEDECDTMTEMEELQNMFGIASSMTGRTPTPASFSAPQSTFPASPFELQEQMENLRKDPAMLQMLSSFMQNMSPDIMANMGEPFGLKLSQEDAEKAQQGISSLTPESLDKMLLWLDRIRRAAELARKTKKLLLGNSGLIFAILMVILAVVVFYVLGYVGA